MIWESEYWKKPLLRLANKIKQWSKQSELTERDLIRIEREIFIAFYSIRKLMEAKKLSDSTEIMPVPVTIHLNKGKDVTHYNWNKIDELYDLDCKQVADRDLRFICNQIIHSYVFLPLVDENGIFQAIIFCSDRERNTNLFRIEASDLLNIFWTVGKDYPSSSLSTLNSRKRDFDIHNQ